jgi:hypothetical protein
MESSSLQTSGSNEVTSSLKDMMVVGNVFETTYHDFARLGITEVTYLGTHGTTSGNYYLIEGTKPDGTKKAFNFSKMKIHSGKIDRHFSHKHFFSSSHSYSSSLTMTSGSIDSASYGDIHIHS